MLHVRGKDPIPLTRVRRFFVVSQLLGLPTVTGRCPTIVPITSKSFPSGTLFMTFKGRKLFHTCLGLLKGCSEFKRMTWPA